MSSHWRDKIATLVAGLVVLLLAFAPLLIGESALPLNKDFPLSQTLIEHLPTNCKELSLYVGYPGCRTECPRALSQLASRLSQQHKEPQSSHCAVFLSLFSGQQEATDRYARSFHQDFIGISIDTAELTPLLESLNLRSQLTQAGTHRDWLYSMKKDNRSWRLVSLDRGLSK